MPMPEFHQLVNEVKKEIQEIDPAALKKMQQSGDDFVLIDVREPDEVSRGTIPGAVAIPRGKLELDIERQEVSALLRRRKPLRTGRLDAQENGLQECYFPGHRLSWLDTEPVRALSN